jgi:SAM-dependent methyltransferase
MSLAVMVDKTKQPDDYWRNEKFVRRFTMNNVNNIRENPGANLFNITQLMATLQGITYLCEMPQSLLDVGCGHSVKSLDLKAKLGCKVVGVDYSRPMLEQARNINSFLPEERRIELHECDAAKLPFADGEFDVCTTYGLLMSLPDAQPAINEMMRVSKYGCVCIEETPDVMDDKQLEVFDRVKTTQYPGRIYWHNYVKLFSRAGVRMIAFSHIPVPDNWDLGSPPGYVRLIGAK